MIVKRIESAGANQRFNGAPIDQAFVDTLTEIEEILEISRTLASLEYRVDRQFPGAFDRPKAIADGVSIDGNEAVFRGVDVRSEHGQLVGEGIVVKNLYRIGIVHVR